MPPSPNYVRRRSCTLPGTTTRTFASTARPNGRRTYGPIAFRGSRERDLAAAARHPRSPASTTAVDDVGARPRGERTTEQHEPESSAGCAGTPISLGHRRTKGSFLLARPSGAKRHWGKLGVRPLLRRAGDRLACYRANRCVIERQAVLPLQEDVKKVEIRLAAGFGNRQQVLAVGVPGCVIEPPALIAEPPRA